MLKNTLKSICFVGLFALAFTSCDDDSDDCQTCATVLIQDGMETSGAGVEVCGDAIDLLLATAGIDSTTMIETRIDCQ